MDETISSHQIIIIKTILYNIDLGGCMEAGYIVYTHKNYIRKKLIPNKLFISRLQIEYNFPFYFVRFPVFLCFLSFIFYLPRKGKNKKKKQIKGIVYLLFI